MRETEKETKRKTERERINSKFVATTGRMVG
jgi:hypothetical protein